MNLSRDAVLRLQKRRMEQRFTATPTGSDDESSVSEVLQGFQGVSLDDDWRTALRDAVDVLHDRKIGKQIGEPGREELLGTIAQLMASHQTRPLLQFDYLQLIATAARVLRPPSSAIQSVNACRVLGLCFLTFPETDDVWEAIVPILRICASEHTSSTARSAAAETLALATILFGTSEEATRDTIDLLLQRLRVGLSRRRQHDRFADETQSLLLSLGVALTDVDVVQENENQNRNQIDDLGSFSFRPAQSRQSGQPSQFVNYAKKSVSNNEAGLLARSHSKSEELEHLRSGHSSTDITDDSTEDPTTEDLFDWPEYIARILDVLKSLLQVGSSATRTISGEVIALLYESAWMNANEREISHSGSDVDALQSHRNERHSRDHRDSPISSSSNAVSPLFAQYSATDISSIRQPDDNSHNDRNMPGQFPLEQVAQHEATLTPTQVDVGGATLAGHTDHSNDQSRNEHGDIVATDRAAQRFRLCRSKTTFDELFNTISQLASSSSKQQAKKGRKTEKSAFRKVLATIERGDYASVHKPDQLKFSQSSVVDIDSWRKLFRTRLLRRVIPYGFHVQFACNQTVRELLEYYGPAPRPSKLDIETSPSQSFSREESEESESDSTDRGSISRRDSPQTPSPSKQSREQRKKEVHRAKKKWLDANRREKELNQQMEMPDDC